MPEAVAKGTEMPQGSVEIRNRRAAIGRQAHGHQLEGTADQQPGFDISHNEAGDQAAEYLLAAEFCD